LSTRCAESTQLATPVDDVLVVTHQTDVGTIYWSRESEGSIRWQRPVTLPAPRSRDATTQLGTSGEQLGPVAIDLETASGVSRLATLEAGSSVELGRGVDAALRIDDESVSARHARLDHQGTAVRIVDLGSRNGVHVGGARVREAWLQIGERAALGRAVIALLEPRDADARLGEPLPDLIGSSRAMRRLAADTRRVAALKLPALLRGATGTGKDLVARALHRESARATGPFVVLNAAAIARDLAESELFGHERGAFTGALRERRGAFREAHGGTLFIDEIAALPLDLQAKLLRVVEDGVVRPLGGEAKKPVDVRLVVATCEPLEAMVDARLFRADLFERLAACVVYVPALRDRREDVADLARHLLRESGLPHACLTPSALRALACEPWPGNVRQLRNVVVQAALSAGDGPVEAAHVAEVIAARHNGRGKPGPVEARRILDQAQGNISEAARRANLPRSTLRDLLRTR